MIHESHIEVIDCSHYTIAGSVLAYDDYIFRATMPNTDAATYTAHKADLMTEPSYKREVYKTGLVDKISVMDQRGMITNVDTKSSINVRKISKELDIPVNTEHGAGRRGRPMECVYVVETWTIRPVSTDKHYNDAVSEYYDNIEYYMDTDNMPYDVIENIKETLKTSRGRAGRASATAIRLITVIPLHHIRDNGVILEASTGLMFTYGEPRLDILHPRSGRHMKASKRINHADLKYNNINVRVIDNTKEVGSLYYAHVFGKMLTLKTEQDNTTNSRVDITLDEPGVSRIYHKSVRIEDMNLLGIYATKEECEYNYNNSAVIEKSKLDLEFKKLESAKEELEHNANKRIKEAEMVASKQEHELQVINKKYDMLELEYSKKLKEYELDMKARKAEHKFKLISYLMDVSNDIRKAKMAKTTHKLDTYKQILGINSVVTKYNAEVAMMDIKQKVSKSDAFSKVVDIGGKVLKTVL